MLGWDGLLAMLRTCWRVVQWFLDVRDAREALAALGLGSIVGDVIAFLITWIRGLPDLVFWPLALVLTVVVARVVSWALTRPAARVPVPTPPGTSPDADAVGIGTVALAGVTASGDLTVNTGVMVKSGEGEAIAKKLDELEAARNKQSFNRRDVLVRLATLRNGGVFKRNLLLTFAGDDVRAVTETAKRAYNEWLNLACEWVERLPGHGEHEANAFRTLDRFSMLAAPDGKYANDGVRWIAAMWSTHLERLEEIRKRYSRPD